MSLLGIDVGTTGCKAVVFSNDGKTLASAYREYNINSPVPGQAELDCRNVWGEVKDIIAEAAAKTKKDPVRALSVASLGEAMVPVTAGREILGSSLLLFDNRGNEYLADLGQRLDNETLYRINGNTLGSHYGLTKLMWIREHQPQLYERADHFLFWSGFVAFMLGAEPTTDYALANRSLVFDLDNKDWSEQLLSWSGLDRDHLPRTVPAATPIGFVLPSLAGDLGLSENVVILSGTHDQCANSIGCGVIEPGEAMFGLGTYHCIVPVYDRRPGSDVMIGLGLNTEHHAREDRYVSFIYNTCGSVVKWHRDTFAAEEHRQALAGGGDVYAKLFAELPEAPSAATVLPHFSVMGPPEYISGSSGVIAGLKIDTTRGEILKAILEGSFFSLRECVERLPEAGIALDSYRAAGGGSRSDACLQLAADILDRPVIRSEVAEAGALGSAILAGVGSGVFPSLEEAGRTMVNLGRSFQPDHRRVDQYTENYRKYRRLWPLLRDYLTADDV